MAHFEPILARRHAHVMPGEWLRMLGSCATGALGAPAELDAWEAAFALALHMPGAAVASSGREAMAAALRQQGVTAGDEVVIPAFTFRGLLPPIQALGARPVPADVDPDTLGVTAESVEARLGPRTRAIVALHALGAPCDLKPILALARARGVVVIEDCAHALGARLDGQPAGSLGYASFFSFEAAKPINTYGGGMLVSRDAALLGTLRRRTRSHATKPLHLLGKLGSVGLEQAAFATGLARPLLRALAEPRLSRVGRGLYDRSQVQVPSHAGYAPVQARVGLQKLAGLDARVQAATQRGRQLAALLRPEIRVQRCAPGGEPSGYAFVVRLPVPAAPLRQRLLARGIDAGVGDEISDDCATLLGDPGCPNLRAVFPCLLQLPAHDGLSAADIERVAAAVNAEL